MPEFQEVIAAELVAKGPIFIGSGLEIKKSEYILHDGRFIIYNIPALYARFNVNQQKSFENMVFSSSPERTLKKWFEEQKFAIPNLKQYESYSIPFHDIQKVFAKNPKRGDKREVKYEFKAFMKDIQGQPYIPGTSLKGMLRTILLCYDIHTNPDKYKYVKRDIINGGKNKPGKRYLSDEVRKIEEIAFHTLNRKERKSDAVNDLLSGLIISDSAPLSLDDLSLCQKIDMHIEGSFRRFPVVRECLKPGTTIPFSITINKTICNYDIEHLEKAVQYFSEFYWECFAKKFSASDVVDEPNSNEVWLGGGVGFVSKTVIYALFGKTEGVKIVDNILKNVFRNKYTEHKHFKDLAWGVSPHTFKVTEFNGRYMEMGRGTLTLKSIK